MYDELKQKIEIFKGHSLRFIPLQDVNNYDLNLPMEWQGLFQQDNYNVSEVISVLWKQVGRDAHDIIDTLISRVIDIMFISSSGIERQTKMCYVFQVTARKIPDRYLNSWVAGLPASSDALKQNAERLGVEKLPSFYEDFCKVHNGFVLNGNSSIGFPPVERLKILSSNDKSRKLLGLCGDGLGNNQCFDLAKSSGQQDSTFDLDHETLDVNETLPFWEFAGSFISRNTKPS